MRTKHTPLQTVAPRQHQDSANEEQGDTAEASTLLDRTGEYVPLHTRRPRDPKQHYNEHAESVTISPLDADVVTRRSFPERHVERNEAVRYPRAIPSSRNKDPVSTTKLWTPLWLRRATLFGFSITFVALLMILSTLYSISVRKHGLGTSVQNYHYAWTYGPTLVFVLISGCWFSVETSLKMLAPWAVLSHAPTSANKSLFLDYVSGQRLVTLYRATRNHHWNVNCGPCQ
jgi:hypothetical protein